MLNRKCNKIKCNNNRNENTRLYEDLPYIYIYASLELTLEVKSFLLMLLVHNVIFESGNSIFVC